MLIRASSMQVVRMAHMSVAQLEIRLHLSGLKRGCQAAELPFHDGARAFTVRAPVSCRVPY